MRPATTTKTRRACRKGRPQRAELSAPGIPYTMRLADGRTVFIEMPARTAVRDRGGELAFTPEGVRFLDRIRALASHLEVAPSPALSPPCVKRQTSPRRNSAGGSGGTN